MRPLLGSTITTSPLGQLGATRGGPKNVRRVIKHVAPTVVYRHRVDRPPTHERAGSE
jgi:hypothetical protein